MTNGQITSWQIGVTPGTSIAPWEQWRLNIASGFGDRVQDWSVGGEPYNSNQTQGTWTKTSSPVPIPGAILLFAPALAGLGFLRRRFTK